MLRRETSPIRASPREVLLGAGLLLLAAVVCLEPAGSHLVEPDETRYAEISREMLASGDFVTPRLNGVPFFEKPPLLYWANAISFEVVGRTAWAARLPSRLAAFATAILLFWGIRRLWGTESGIAAGLFYLVSPLSFVLSRVDVTDGLLTFFFAATLFAARETIRRHEQGQSTLALSAATGAAAAGAMLTKGAVGVLLPVLILCLWCVLTGRLRYMRPLFLGPALVIFLLLCLPWFLLVEQRNPGFLHFFFVREHFLRFTTPLHQRDAPFFYFLLVFLGGFLAGLPFLGATVSACFAPGVNRGAGRKSFFSSCGSSSSSGSSPFHEANSPPTSFRLSPRPRPSRAGFLRPVWLSCGRRGAFMPCW